MNTDSNTKITELEISKYLTLHTPIIVLDNADNDDNPIMTPCMMTNILI